MPDASNRYLTVANSVYDRRFSASNPQAKFVLEESKLLEFPKLVENSFVSVMKQSKMPALERARIWGWAPDRLRELAYPQLAETLTADAEAAGLDPERAFPAPARSQPDSAAPRSPAQELTGDEP